MSLCSVPDNYDVKHIQDNGIKESRIIPLFDSKIENIILNLQNQKLEIFDNSLPILNKEHTVDVMDKFTQTFTSHLKNSTRNSLTGFDGFNRVDICSGCTQYIDDLYIKNNKVQVLHNEYNYHERLNCAEYVSVSNLIPEVPLIISLPFCYDGKVHPEWNTILEKALERKIPVHIDGAWISCAKNINFDFNHPAVHSFAISMSKGYGTSGWNRIALRWTREFAVDSITLLTDFYQHTAYPIAVANHVLENISPDHLWNTHEENYYKICKDFDLEPTQSIHVATKGKGWIYGIAPLLRYLEYNQ
jgi:hypothetical protein